MSSSLRRLTRCAVLTALALALSVAEGLVPLTILFPLPGLRLGLANLVTIYALCTMSGREALLILLAGALVFCPVRGRRFSFMEEGRRSRFWVLFAVGSGVGFVAGLTGAGGPVLSVPIMIALGFPPLIAIGAGQVYSVPVALSGSAANFLHGAIDYKVGALMIVIQILGILLGVYMANRMDTTKLRKMVAWVCLFCGGFILVNAIRGILAM